jgi:hypothetical protein
MSKTIDPRAQISRFDPVASEWKNVYRAPMIRGKYGEVERKCGYRGMAVAQGRSDSQPTLYVLPFSTARSIGPVMLRSEGGQHFEAVSRPGLGYSAVSSFRFLVPFNGRLYTSLVGSTNYVANESTFPVVFETAHPAIDRMIVRSPR